MKFVTFVLIHIVLLQEFVYGQQQQIAPMRFAIKGREIKLPCAVPNDATFLKWKFNKNGTNFAEDAAQVFPGNIPTIFVPFDSPAGRSELKSGSLIIHQVEVKDEGHYWCEISNPNAATAYSNKYPVHVFVTPLEPQITSLNNKTLTEHKNITVARCSSQGGKPGSSLTWMNGSVPMSSDNDVVYSKNAFNTNDLTDATVDLLISNPTRFDHKRSFSCIIDHPAYEGKQRILNYTILVKYHPINVRIWANLTSLFLYCGADSYPGATYSWKMPGGITGFKGESLYVQDLFDMPGYDYFECTADNGIPPNATARIKVDDLLYPDGKPGWAGLDWWVWGAILGGVAVLIITVILIIIYCVRKRKNTSDKPVKYTKPEKRPLANEYSAQQPTSLQIDLNYRRPDGREDSFDSRTPSPKNEHKRALIDGVFNQSRENITLIPSGDLRRSRENMYSDNRNSMHASREQLDQVASHIQTLNKSWDHLSKSREQLNEAQDELQGVNPNLHKSREQLYHSREALNRDNDQNYPYIDEGTTRSSDYHPHEQRDGNGRGDPPSYDYEEQNYNTNQGYDRRNQDYQGQGNQDYQGHDQYNDQDSYNRDNSQEDARYDDRGYNNRQNDRQDYSYQDPQYRQDDRYPSKRIV